MSIFAEASAAPATNNTAAVATLTNANSGQRVQGSMLDWSYSADPPAGTAVIITDNVGTVKRKYYIIKGGPGFIDITGIQSPVGGYLVATAQAAAGIFCSVGISGNLY